MKRSVSSQDDDSHSNNEPKRLKGIEIHPLLSYSAAPASIASSTGSLITRTDALSLNTNNMNKKANPYLAHSQPQQKQNKRHERVAFLDRRLPTAPSQHTSSRALKFNVPGQLSREAEEQRQAALQRQLQREIAQLSAQVDESSASASVGDAEIVADLLMQSEDALEWWDAPFLTDAHQINFDMLGNLIQRPSLRFMTSKSTKNSTSTPTASIYLTKEERKKLRRQRRLEAQRELQEKIALGLVPPPPPKVKLSSLPRMLAQPGNQLGNDSVLDPTRLAAEIKAQSEARAAAHHEANQTRALTPEERAAKKYRKFAELDAESVHVVAFKINDRLEDGALRFKVLMNAEQNHLRGRLIVGPHFSLLVAEGGPRGIKRYCHLLQERMLRQTFPGWAQLLWQGEQPAFDSFGVDEGRSTKFLMESFESEFDAEEAVRAAGIHSYWKLAQSQ